MFLGELSEAGVHEARVLGLMLFPIQHATS